MVRVPDTLSIAALYGEDLRDVPDDPVQPYADLSPAEIDQLIIRCRRALASHRRDSLRRDVAAAEDALAAIETIQVTLAALLRIAPEGKRAKIEALLRL